MDDTRAFTTRLADLLRREHHALADFLIALAEFDRDRRWLELGYTSCFYFLHRELGLSKGAAFYRKTAAELIWRFPEILEPLRDGRLCLTSVVELSKVLTPENRGEVLPRFFHASKREAREVVAELRPVEAAPQREVVTVARAAPSERCAQPAQSAPVPPGSRGASVPSAASAIVVHPANQLTAAQAPVAQRPDEIEPLSGELRRFHVTVSKRFLEKLASARSALGHSHPHATTEAVLELALDLLLEKKAKQRGLLENSKRPVALHVEATPHGPPLAPSVAPKPRGRSTATSPAATPDSGNPRHVQAEVKRAVWERDGGRCQWPASSGGICGSTFQLELDHIVPVARGGPSSIDNLRVVCRAHNQLAARQVFGATWMERYTKGAPGRDSA
jgi:5-methylcytosine-specific restriction endonuclease McrA